MRFARRLAVIAGVIVAAVLAYRVLGVYEFRSDPCRARTPSAFQATFPEHVVVMSFNIQGHATLIDGDHIEEIARTIQRYSPDVVAINEAHRNTWQARFGDQVEQLRRLTGMNGVFGRSFTFAGGEFGNAILTKGEIVGSEIHELPGRGEPRTLLESVIRINGGTVTFYATHTAAWASLGRAPRAAQLRCIAQHVRASRYPYILAGDLNAAPQAVEMNEFLTRNALRLIGDPGAATHRVLRTRLDYILTGPGWRAVRAEVLEDGPSDHRPVIARLTKR